MEFTFKGKRYRWHPEKTLELIVGAVMFLVIILEMLIFFTGGEICQIWR